MDQVTAKGFSMTSKFPSRSWSQQPLDVQERTDNATLVPNNFRTYSALLVAGAEPMWIEDCLFWCFGFWRFGTGPLTSIEEVVGGGDHTI